VFELWVSYSLESDLRWAKSPCNATSLVEVAKETLVSL